jgi:hypothetical protein
VNVDPFLLSLLTGTLLPLVVGVVTKTEASPKLKAVVLAALAALSGYLVNVVSDTGVVEWEPVVTAMLTAAVAAWSGYQSLWKPTGVAPAVQAATAGVGIGPRGA